MIEIKDCVHKICDLVKKHDISFIDAVLKLSEDENYEIEYLAGIIKNNPLLFTNIQQEAENLNFLPKTARLPI
jgi:hypothetical protein